MRILTDEEIRDKVAEWLWNNHITYKDCQLHILAPNPSWIKLKEQYPQGKGVIESYKEADQIINLFPSAKAQAELTLKKVGAYEKGVDDENFRMQNKINIVVSVCNKATKAAEDAGKTMGKIELSYQNTGE